MTPEVPSLIASPLYALAWWGMLFGFNAVGWIALRPLVVRWHDAGWALARPLAVLGCAFLVWTVAHFVPLFRAELLRPALLIPAAALLILAAKRIDLGGVGLRRMIAAEIRFLVPFVFYLFMRGLNHDIIGLEKFMDFSFVASALRVDSLPVPDPWFSGGSINYYYFGHYVTAFLCKLSGIPPAFGYNLMLATLFGSTFQLAYAFVAEMSEAIPAQIRGATAFLAGVWLTLGGNFHGFLYGFVRPWLVDGGFVEPPSQSFLVSDPTRFVGWDPPTQDKLIHEFPAYAFYVGDLHAHLINLPNVVLFWCVLLAWQRARSGTEGTDRFWLAIAAWLVGLAVMGNSWDGLMCAGALAVFLALPFVQSLRTGRSGLGEAVTDGVLSALVGAATVAPFFVTFHPHSEGFFPTHSHTPLWQWLILYGVHVTLALGGCLIAFRGGYSLIPPPARRVLVAMTLLGITFVLIPEFYYLKDIYGGEYYRGNTAFKFGFHAFTLLTLAGCVAAGLMLSIPRTRRWRTGTVLALELAVVPPLYYAWFVFQGSFSVWVEREWTLDGQRYLALSHPEDRAAAAWLLQQSGAATLVEAAGDSYTFAARISANTGIPAVLGWPVHEQLWRGSDPEVWARRDDVNRLYEAKDAVTARQAIEPYRPRWLIVGRFERERYGSALNPQLLATLGTTVFSSGDTFIVELTRGAETGTIPGAPAN